MNYYGSFNHPYLHYWNEYGKEELIRVWNNFSRASLLYEQQTLEEIVSQKSEKENQQFLDQIKQLIREFNDLEKPEAMIRLGAGKTFYDNSYGIALYNKDKKLFQKYRRLFMLEPLQDIYPITRTVSVVNDNVGMPLGWVKVKL